MYRERARLLGGYVAMFGGVMAHNDVECDWPVLYIETPKGQCSWHIHPDDVDLFQALKVPVVEGYPWDGHGTEEKHLRIEALNSQIPKLTYAKPEFGNP
ncbi:hypothetical protein AB0M10_15335 [Streptomyces sp. NPDC051840]|uniref:WDGH domain-containing protein n=1 Tax=Streptomyces sp. NPDC051840 TaxID=3154752 RepID=UPI00342CADEA